MERAYHRALRRATGLTVHACKRGLRSILAILFVWLASCTTKEIYPDGKGTATQLAVLGEINTSDPPRLFLTLANNLTRGGAPVQGIDEAEAVLKDEQSAVLSQFKKTGQDGYWVADLKALSGSRYCLYIHSQYGDCTSTVSIPEGFSVKVAADGDNNMVVDIENNSNKKKLYVVELVEDVTNGTNKLLQFDCNDTFSDNYRFNEIPYPYYRLFINTDQNKVSVRIKPSGTLTVGTKYALNVKSVDNVYYTYLYNSEAQKASSEKRMELVGNIDGALGIFGSAYKVTIHQTVQ